MIRQVFVNGVWDGSYEPYYDEGVTPYEIVELCGYDWQAELGEGTYPIWDESMREWLNTQIYNNFLYREIGQETAESFFRWMRLKMNQIMPVLNPIAAFALGKTAASEDWRLVSETITTGSGKQAGESHNTGNDTSVNSGENTTTTTADTNSQMSNLASTTPQVQLSGTENYMTGLDETGSRGHSEGTDTTTLGTKNVTDSTGDGSWKQDSESESDTKHYEGLAAELAQRWLEAAPDLLGNIYAGLESLFVQVW